MWLWLPLGLVLSAVAAPESAVPSTAARVSFRPVGEAFRLATHAHLTLDVDVGAWVKACDVMLSRFALWETDMNKLSPTIRKDRDDALDLEHHVSLELQGLREELELACDPLRMVVDSEDEDIVARSKRQLLAFLGGTILGLFGLPALANVEQDELEKNQRHMVVGIKSNTHRIGALEEDMDRMHAGLTLAMETALKQSSAIHAIQRIDHVKSLTRGFIRRVDVVSDTVDHIFHQRLSPKALGRRQLDDAITRVDTNTNAVGFVVAFNHPSDVFQSPASFLLRKDGKMRLFVHLAVRAQDAKPMRVFRYMKTPIRVNDHTYATIEGEEDIIMVSYDQAWSQAISPTTLEACQHLGSVYVCEEPRVFRRNMSSYCVGAMFQGDQPAVAEQCQVRLHRDLATAVPVARDRFVLFHAHTTTAYISCPGMKTTREEFSGWQEKTLEPGCEVITKELGFRNSPTIAGVDTPFRVVDVDLPDELVLRDVEDVRLEKAMGALAKVGTNRPTDAEVRKVLAELDEVTWTPHNSVMTAVAVGAVVILAGILGCLGWRLRHHFKRTAPSGAFRLENRGESQGKLTEGSDST